jgi:hypothetical protein
MEEHLAMFQICLPVNPLPFLNKAAELIRENDTGYVRSDKVKAVLWIVLAQAYGQLAVIDLNKEWDRLKQVFES